MQLRMRCTCMSVVIDVLVAFLFCFGTTSIASTRCDLDLDLVVTIKPESRCMIGMNGRLVLMAECHSFLHLRS